MIRTWNAVIEGDARTGLYVGYVPGWPGAHSQGETLDEVRANQREAAEGWLAVAHEDGHTREAAGEA